MVSVPFSSIFQFKVPSVPETGKDTPTFSSVSGNSVAVLPACTFSVADFSIVSANTGVTYKLRLITAERKPAKNFFKLLFFIFSFSLSYCRFNFYRLPIFPCIRYIYFNTISAQHQSFSLQIFALLSTNF